MKIFLIEGESGVGKTTLVNKLKEKHPGKYNEIVSYTTRSPRTPDETGHIFVTVEEMIEHSIDHKIVASTKINNEFYCAFEDQFSEHKPNIYIVDDLGIMDIINLFLHSEMENVQIYAMRIKRTKSFPTVDEDRRSRYHSILPDDFIALNVFQDPSVDELINFIEKKC